MLADPQYAATDRRPQARSPGQGSSWRSRITLPYTRGSSHARIGKRRTRIRCAGGRAGGARFKYGISGGGRYPRTHCSPSLRSLRCTAAQLPRSTLRPVPSSERAGAQVGRRSTRCRHNAASTHSPEFPTNIKHRLRVFNVQTIY